VRASDTTITAQLQGRFAALRAASHASELGLSFVVKDEVLLITSADNAQSPEFMTTKVYPVGDLVITPV